MPSIISKVISLIISLWIAKVFLSSLPYKFTNHPDTQHIFSTIGQWMSETISHGLGSFFSQYGAILVGSVELIVSVFLLAASIIWIIAKIKGNSHSNSSWAAYQKIYCVAGLASSATMLGAAFFHLFTPLGIEVIHEGKNDGGSLFYAAVSILFLGLVLALINRPKSTER